MPQNVSFVPWEVHPTHCGKYTRHTVGSTSDALWEVHLTQWWKSNWSIALLLPMVCRMYFPGLAPRVNTPG